MVKNKTLLGFCYFVYLFRVVDNQIDGHILQGDLDVLCIWTETWNMSFNVARAKSYITASQ